MTRHQEQVDAVVQRGIQKILGRGLNDPRIRGLVSVVRVVVSPDSSEARVWCSVLPAKHADSALHGLNAAAGWIGRRLGDEVRMRRVPRLKFLLDESIKKEAQVLGAIQEAVRREDQESPPDSEEATS
ncbi:MAG: 30S ribosome-binding factor RbfA [Phycisphaerales bacterium]|jgi:ribosome-binding factor A|nr:30S ribosome-binding factor RbfA [Phycisphaerales bacterium]